MSTAVIALASRSSRARRTNLQAQAAPVSLLCCRCCLCRALPLLLLVLLPATADVTHRRMDADENAPSTVNTTAVININTLVTVDCCRATEGRLSPQWLQVDGVQQRAYVPATPAESRTIYRCLLLIHTRYLVPGTSVPLAASARHAARYALSDS